MISIGGKKFDGDTPIVVKAKVLGSAIHSYSMNFLGLPAGNVPAACENGLPIGVQIVGRKFREDMILDACEAIEQHVGIMAHRLFGREISTFPTGGKIGKRVTH